MRRGVFDGAISISAVQWLCNADRSSHDPRKRLKRFFETLYASLARGARAVLQVGWAGRCAGSRGRRGGWGGWVATDGWVVCMAGGGCVQVELGQGNALHVSGCFCLQGDPCQG